MQPQLDCLDSFVSKTCLRFVAHQLREFRCGKHFEESVEKKPKGLLRAYTVGLPMKVDEIADNLKGDHM